MNTISRRKRTTKTTTTRRTTHRSGASRGVSRRLGRTRRGGVKSAGSSFVRAFVGRVGRDDDGDVDDDVDDDVVDIIGVDAAAATRPSSREPGRRPRDERNDRARRGWKLPRADRGVVGELRRPRGAGTPGVRLRGVRRGGRVRVRGLRAKRGDGASSDAGARWGEESVHGEGLSV